MAAKSRLQFAIEAMAQLIIVDGQKKDGDFQQLFVNLLEGKLDFKKDGGLFHPWSWRIRSFFRIPGVVLWGPRVLPKFLSSC